MPCLDEDTLAAMAAGALAEAEREAVQDHADGCAACRRAIAALAQLSLLPAKRAGDEPAAPKPAAPGPGERLGRYLLLRPLGAGAMGVVHAAYDPVLDRKVAIKLLRGGRGVRDEAKALARLAHPNVIAVHEVGEADGRELIVMEHVDGLTLSAWLDERPRRWREVVRVLAGAAHGLAAVHDAGLVHRDIKPSNILVGADGRARIGDFGLAVGAAAAGEVAGTPRFLAPEAAAGHADARSDQFAFGVTLAEALPATAPRWARVIATRARAPAPADRFPSMHALARELERDRRTPTVLAALAAVAVAGAGVGLAARDGGGAGPAPCGGAAVRIAPVWSAAHADALARQFATTGRPHAAATAQRVVGALDDYRAAWIGGHTAACRATRVEGTQSEALLDARMRCHHRLLLALEARVALLAEADADLVDRAVELVDALSPVADCAGELPAAPLPGGERRAEVEALQRRLAAVRAQRDAGRLRPALAEAESMRTAVAGAGFAPLTAEHAFVLGELLAQAEGRNAEGEAVLRDALVAAAAAGDDRLAVAVWTTLITVVGNARVRFDEALAWEPFARAAIARVAGTAPDPLLGAELDQAIATVLVVPARWSEATARAERALAARRARLGDDHPLVGASHDQLCSTRTHGGAPAEAIAHCRRSAAILERHLGREHPRVAAAHLNLAVAMSGNGDYAGALPIVDDAAALLERTLGGDHPLVARAITNLAALHERLGHREQQLAAARRVVAIRERTLGADDPRTAAARSRVGVALLDHGDLDGARVELEAALAVQRRAFGDGHPDVATTHQNLAELALEAGDHAAARAHALAAVAGYEASVGADHRDLVVPLWLVGRVALAERRPQAAIAPLERALALPEIEPLQAAELRFVLAQALWAAGKDRRRALELARAALAAQEDDDGRAPIAAWLEKRRQDAHL